MLRVDLKDVNIEVSTYFVDEDEDLNIPIEVIAKVATDKQSYAIQTKIASKNLPKKLDTRVRFAACIGECIIQAAAQADEQLISPQQLSLFDTADFQRIQQEITFQVGDLVSQEATV